MKILSLDTAMAACSAAIVDTDQPIALANAFQPMERGHAETLPPMVADLLRASALDIANIDRVAVTVGPGTFTGVRIALSFARGIGASRGIPVVGIDSLSAIAANEPAGRPLLVASDARNGEVFAAVFDAARRVVVAPCLTGLTGAAETAPTGSLVIGSASRAVIEASGRGDLEASAAGDLPVAARFARLAASAPPAGMPAPLYLRVPDAKPQAAALRMASIAIEEISASAASILAALHAEAFETGWCEGAFEDLLSTPGSSARLALELGEPTAFLLTRRAADEAEIITIATRPRAQRRGVAAQLLARHLAELAQQGVRKVFLEVAASNTAALGLYRALGFSEAGLRKGYYTRAGGAEDAVVMRRELPP